MVDDLEIIRKMEKQIGQKLERSTGLEAFFSKASGAYELGENGNVEKLTLASMGLKEMPSSIFKLRHLVSLHLYNNQLAILPKEVSQFKKLERLNLGKNQFGCFPDEILKCTSLTHLSLHTNNITNLPRDIIRLKNLTFLSFHDNTISKLPQEIGQLTGLIECRLYNNKLTSLPKEICWLVNLTKLSVYDNPLKSPPPEIARKGIPAIREYFYSLEGKKQTLNEAKIILVGDGGAGKTSLVRCILKKQFRKNESQTHGIDINKWEVKNGAKSIKVRLWDFGGQEIMHATHQFFLSKRSLYILVLNAREEKKAEYWLKYIESFGGDSSILVVINKIDENPSFEENRKFLTAKYKGIKGFHRISCASGDGIDKFKEHLIEEVKQVELRQSLWAENWLNIKDKLEDLTEHYINYNDYQELCDLEKIETEQRTTLIEYLHDLGIVLHFKNLAHKNVLNPKWVTEAVYKIINSKETARKYGIIYKDEINKILNKEEFTDNKLDLTLNEVAYTLDERNYIVDLMKEFELCYSLNKNRILIPDLLDVQEPDFDFDYENCIRFKFDYDFLPHSIMPRFIVKMHEDTEGNHLWRTGIILKNKAFQARAMVIADDHAREINLYVNGRQKRNYFAAILYAFREINNSFEKLTVKEMVPISNDSQVIVSYNHLLVLTSEKIENFVPDGSDKQYSVQELLGEIQIIKPEENEIMEILIEIRDKLKSVDQSSLMRVLEVKPNFFGVGLDLEPLIKKVFTKITSK